MKFDFLSNKNEKLAGKIELPQGEPKAYALFAHCFTCSKNFIASSSISKALAKEGIATLRFDFTGLGNSEGDFSNENFTSNVDDLISAYEALKKEFKAPELLIGHSLGGAAILKASTLLNDPKAVVTIGAPSCTSHVSHLFESKVDEIQSEGQAIVNLAGREFKIQKQFIEDINEVKILEDLKKVRKSFLIMHSPVDDTVSIDHAEKIYRALKHPKSFISLDKSDHLVTNRNYAEYIAKTITAWYR